MIRMNIPALNQGQREDNIITGLPLPIIWLSSIRSMSAGIKTFLTSSRRSGFRLTIEMLSRGIKGMDRWSMLVAYNNPWKAIPSEPDVWLERSAEGNTNLPVRGCYVWPRMLISSFTGCGLCTILQWLTEHPLPQSAFLNNSAWLTASVISPRREIRSGA